jgi:hypothetical protein
MTPKQFIKQVEKHRDAIGKERDKLRELIGGAEDLAFASEEAMDALNSAIDSLSELA